MNRIENNEEKYVKHKKDSKNIIIKRKIKIIFIIIFILIIFIAIKTGIYISKWQNLAQDMISNTPSKVIDRNGNVIAEIGNSKNTKNISIANMPKNLINAYISIEDQRFYKHHGVDFPRTTAAIFSYIRNLGSASFGGSSITQQLVKNLTGDNSSKVTRKINEWIKALSLEGVLEKDQILEAYLNVIYVGPNIYGVELGANYYFDKSVFELDLAECAFLAGINNSPNSYNPFGEEDNQEKIKIRTQTVLSKMLELKYINETEYNEAISKLETGIKFKKGKIVNEKENNIYSYHTDALLTEIIDDISNKKKISKNFATNYIEMAGLTIYSTQDSNIQKTIEDELSKKKYILKSNKDSSVTSQAAMIVIENSTGQVLGCVGGIGEKTSRGFNRATQALRQTGSSGKPLSVLLPAIDKKIITPATIFTDEPTTFDDGTEEGYSPTDYNDYKGQITVRSAVESSQNIPFVKIMEQVTPKVSIDYMKKLGITSLTKTDENLNLALGGLDKGISPLEMAVSYETIANNGIYTNPTFYTKIENAIGKIVVKSKQKSKEIFSKQVAYILQSLLTQPVKGIAGTAKYCNISGIDVAAKTGTTNEDYDRWLCGFTPYYTAVTWFGFDLNETIYFNNKNPSGQIWSSVMKTIHSGLPNKTFEIPDKGIVTAEICPKTGLLSNTGCSNSYTEYFLEGTAPTTYCTEHSGNNIIKNAEPNNQPNTSSLQNNTSQEVKTTEENDTIHNPDSYIYQQEQNSNINDNNSNNDNNNNDNNNNNSNNNNNNSSNNTNTTNDENKTQNTLPEINNSTNTTNSNESDINNEIIDNTFEQ